MEYSKLSRIFALKLKTRNYGTRKAKEIINLFGTSKRLNKFITTTLPKLRQESRSSNYGYGNVDKHIDGFRESGQEIQSVNMELSYYSFSGTFGDSSTYSDLDFDREIAKKYFIKWLNKNADRIWLEVAELIKRDALEQREEVQKELDDYNTKIAKLFLEMGENKETKNE